jgi:hypothetical protein
MFEDAVIPLDVWVSQFVDWLVDNYRDFFQALKWPVETTLNGFDAGLNWAAPHRHHRGALRSPPGGFPERAWPFFPHYHMTLIGLLGCGRKP